MKGNQFNEKVFYSMQSKKVYGFKYLFLTKKGIIILLVAIAIGSVIAFSLPVPFPANFVIFLLLVYGLSKVFSANFPITETDVRNSFQQVWWRKKRNAEKGECRRRKWEEILRRRYGSCG